MKKKIIQNKKPKKVSRRNNKNVNAPINKSSYGHMLGLGIIFLLGVIIYSNSFNNSFHLDDIGQIVENVKIRNLSDINVLWASQSRFVAYYSFALNYHFGELNVWGYHLVNLIIHLINASLVYWLTFLIFSSPVLKGYVKSKDKMVIAFIAAILFVSHPLATQSVTYIVQRLASMVTLFYLLSLVLYFKARLSQKHRSKYLFFAGSLIAAILAMHTKENSFTLPFAIVLTEIFFLQKMKVSINFKDYRVILLIVGLLGFILISLFTVSTDIFKPIAPDPTNDYRLVTSLGYLFTQFSVIVKYIGLLIVPINQNLDYDILISYSFFDLRTILSFLFLLALIIIAAVLFKKNRIISFGIFWFFLTLSIESSIIPISDLMFEHRTYLPSFGFFLSLSVGIYLLLWNKYRYIAIAVIVFLVGSNSVLTYKRNKIWKDQITLLSDVISKSPNKARAYNNRGVLLMNENRNREAFNDLNKAISLSDKYANAYYNRGVLFMNEKKYESALKDFFAAIQLDKTDAKSYFNRAIVLKAINRPNEALKDYNKAIELNSNFYEAYYNRGDIFYTNKNYKEAINDYDKALSLKNDLAQAYYNRGLSKHYIGEKVAACNDMRQAINLGVQVPVDLLNVICN